ncbi:unnamed protein product [Camellia sinensis]
MTVVIEGEHGGPEALSRFFKALRQCPKTERGSQPNDALKIERGSKSIAVRGEQCTHIFNGKTSSTWALTGESLPITKRTGDEVFSGSTCKQGEIEAIVIATGVHSFFGKAAHLVDSTESIGHFQKVLTAIGNFCICSIVVGMILEIIVMYPIQLRSYRDGINNLLVLLIGGIPTAMPTVLSITLAIGSHRLSQQGAIAKRMTSIEEMAGMDVLRSDKTRTLTLNRLTIDQNLIEASRLENQDAIDIAIVNMLADPKEACANITEVHFLHFNPVEKCTPITYIDSDGNWYRASQGSFEQIGF